MSLHPTMKRRLHERLHPLIGAEEADALLDEISPQDPVTREWLETRFDRIDDRFATREHLDARLDGVKHELMGAVHRKVMEQTVLLVVLTTFLGGILSIAQIIWG